MNNFKQKYMEVLELFKTKYQEKYPETDTLNSYLNLGYVTVYFNKSDGDVNNYNSIKYRDLEITKYTDNTGWRIEYSNPDYNPSQNLNLFKWLTDIEKSLNGEENILPNNYFAYPNEVITVEKPKIIEVEKEKIIEVENKEHKVKADILDSLLAKSKVILEG